MATDVDDLGLPVKSPKLVAICQPRWVGWKNGKPDPCDGCPLNRPCIKDGDLGNALTLKGMVKWRIRLNEAAEALESLRQGS